MRIILARELSPMPSRADNEEIVAMTASITGRLAVLTVHRGTAPTRQEPFDGSGSAAWATLHVQDEPGVWQRITLDGPAVSYPHLALLPDGDVLIVDARCRRYPDGSTDDNAHIVDPTGAHRGAFCLGDGIEHIGVDAAGTIWVAYFDEGVFGNLGWRRPIGAAGLVRFSRQGDRLWAYDPPSGASAIADCYALNVDARVTWLYYYTDFPLVRISNGRSTA